MLLLFSGEASVHLSGKNSSGLWPHDVSSRATPMKLVPIFAFPGNTIPSKTSPSGGTCLGRIPWIGGQIRISSLTTACRYGNFCASARLMTGPTVWKPSISLRNLSHTRLLVASCKTSRQKTEAFASALAMLADYIRPTGTQTYCSWLHQLRHGDPRLSHKFNIISLSICFWLAPRMIDDVIISRETWDFIPLENPANFSAAIFFANLPLSLAFIDSILVGHLPRCNPHPKIFPTPLASFSEGRSQ